VYARYLPELREIAESISQGAVGEEVEVRWMGAPERGKCEVTVAELEEKRVEE